MRHCIQPYMEFSWYLLILWSVSTTLTVIHASDNIAFGKTTFQSSTHYGLDSSKAVDNCDLTYEASNCCTRTQAGETEVWWQVDLQTPSVIDYVNIIYRDERTLNTFAGYEVYLSNSQNWTTGTRCHKDTTTDLASMPYTQNVSCPGVARYLTIYNDRREKAYSWYSDDAVLELCEVQVYGCPVGKFGNGSCNHDCMNCLGDICDASSGTCVDCAAGNYNISGMCILCPVNCVAKTCDRLTGACSECDAGFHGSFCNQSCPVHCKNNVCNRDSGQCTDCEDGYFGSFCDACNPGCNDDVCDKVSGNCSKCKDGYYGSTCAKTCPVNCNNSCIKENGFCTGCQQGFHGNACQHPCPNTCKDKECSQSRGQCEECETAYHGIICSLSCPDNCKDHICMQKNGQCIECNSGFHGSKCFDRCGYCEGVSCDKETGNCMTSCIEGMTGATCDVKVVVVKVEDKTAVIGIGSSFGVVIVALVIVIIVQAKRKRSGNQRDTTRSTTMTDISLPNVGQQLRAESDDPADIIDTKKRNSSDLNKGTGKCHTYTRLND